MSDSVRQTDCAHSTDGIAAAIGNGADHHRDDAGGHNGNGISRRDNHNNSGNDNNRDNDCRDNSFAAVDRKGDHQTVGDNDRTGNNRTD